MLFKRNLAMFLVLATVLTLFTAFPVMTTVSAAKNLSSDVYYVSTSDKVVFEVKPQTTVAVFAGNLSGYEEYEMFDGNGNEKVSSDLVCNGDVFAADEIEYTVIIKGDLNGDGAVTSSDLISISAHINSANTISIKNVLLSADVDYNGSITSTDYISLLSHLSGVIDIYDNKHPDNTNSSSSDDSSEESKTTYYDVNFVAGANGDLTGGTSVSVESGTSFDSITVPTPVAKKGYKFSGWTPSFPNTVTSNLTFTALFEKDASLWHTVTFVSGDNGSISGTTVFTEILNGTSFADAVTVPEYQANAGYSFAGWSPALPETVTADATYTATFTVDDTQYATVTFIAGNYGSFEDGSSTKSFTILKGTSWSEIDVPECVANAGFSFGSWSPEFPETVTESATYTASFDYDSTQYAQVTFVAGANGTISGTNSFVVLKGTDWSEITVPSYTANAGYKFSSWSPEFPETVDEDATYTANFVYDESQYATVTFVAGSNGAISGNAEYTVLKGTAWSEITVPTTTANDGYRFKGWNNTFPTTVTASASFTAEFEAIPKYSINFNAGTNGTMDGTPTYTVYEGTSWSEIEVPTITANTGYTFKGWDANFPTTITEDLTFTAVYEEIPKYSVVFVAGTNGSISGTWYFENIDSGAYWGDIVTVPTPVPDEGYTFVSWTPVIPSDNTPITGDMEFTALFAVEEPVSTRENYAASSNGGSYVITTGNKLTSNSYTDPNFTVTSTETYYDFSQGNVNLQFGNGYLNDDQSVIEDTGNWVELSRSSYTSGWSTVSNKIVLVYKLSEAKSDIEQIIINCGLTESTGTSNRGLPNSVTVNYSTKTSYSRNMSWKSYGTSSTFEHIGGYGHICTIEKSVDSSIKYIQIILDMTDYYVGRIGEVKILGPESVTTNKTVSFVAGSNGSLSGTTSYTIASGTAWSSITVPTPKANSGYVFSGWSPELPSSGSTITTNLTYTAIFEEASSVSTNYALASNGAQYYMPVGTLYGVYYSNNSFMDTFNPADGYGSGYLNDGSYLTSTDDNWVEIIYTEEKIELIFKLATAIDVEKFVAHVGMRSGSTNRGLPESVDVYVGETESNISTLLGTITSFDQASDYGYIGALWATATNVSYVKFVCSSTIYITRFGEMEVWGTPTSTVPKYNVSFSAGNNGSLSGTTSFTVEEGATWADIAVPTPVANAGYKFTGWTPALPDSGDAITGDVTYTANFAFDGTQWSTITFQAGSNGSLSGTTSVTVLNGTSWSSVTVPTPVANSGYSFIGWTPSFPSTVTASGTFTANFEETPIEYFTITFTAGTGGTLSGTTSFTVESGTAWSSITVPTPVANSGYSFSGWSASFPSTVTSNATYTANFTKDTVYYTITFKAGTGGTLSGTTSFTVAEGTAWSNISVPTPVANTGYTFSGWSASFPSTVTSNATYTANFTAVYYTITFTAGTGGSLSGTKSYTVQGGAAWSSITVPTPVANSGYRFTSWSASFPSTITANASFTANFELIPTYTVEFLAGTGGTLGGTKSFTVQEGALWSTITVPTATANDGYTFNAWSPALPSDSTAITTDMSFTAQFIQENASMTLEGVITLNGVNASQYTSGGSHLYTSSYSSAFTATYWDVFVAEYSEEKGGYVVTEVYRSETTKSVYVPTDGIIVAVHLGSETQTACSLVDVGDVLVLSSDVDVDNSSIVAGTSTVSIYTGDGSVPGQGGESGGGTTDPDNPGGSTGTAYEQLNYTNVKAMWLSQFDLNGVFTSGSSQRSESSFRSLMTTILNNCKDMGFNTIIVQVRPNGDSMYPSDYYTMSKYVVGSYGKTASYDPFEIIIEMAHEINLSVQAWINPLRLMTSSDITKVETTYKVGEWYNSSTYNGKYVVLYSSYYYLNPAYEEVRNLIINGAKEICEKYEVDGVHMDDYFYPTTDSSFDSAAYSAYSGSLSLANWRRSNLNALVSGIYTAVKSVDPDILFGISPAGNLSTVYNSQYADVYTWCSTTGYIDYICPQVYFGMLHSSQSVPTCTGNWANIVTNSNVTLYVGLTLGKAVDGYNGTVDTYAGTTEGKYEWVNNRDVIKSSLEYIRDNVDKCTGIAFFCYQYFYNPTSGAARSETAEERANFLPIFQAMWN